MSPRFRTWFALAAAAASVAAFSSRAASSDTAAAPAPAPRRQVQIVTTAVNTELRLSAEPAAPFEPLAQPVEKECYVFVLPNHAFQTLIGIGGALTDAAAETFAKLPPAAQDEFLRACYDPEFGIGYTFGRTHIASCDFSSESYAYVADGDESLRTFSVAHDERHRLPFIRKAIAAAGGKLTLFASAWSPPAWMKDNHDVAHGGKLLPQYREAWANHFVAFIRAYEQHGVPIWGLTVQNEPMATQKWESCLFTAEEERDFIKQHLGPALERAGLADRKLIAWDHNRDLVVQRAATVLDDPDAARFVWGIGYHWYETWTGAGMAFENIRLVHEMYPQTHLVFTEGCYEKFDRAKIDTWAVGERYGTSMINDFNAGTEAWSDWNVLLDERGGPNHVGNFCFAPIHADTPTGRLTYTSAYYYIGQFSKFIRPGAVRVAASASRDTLQTTAFRNPGGELVVVVMNRTDKPQPYKLWLSGDAATLTARPHSISTLLVK